VSSNISEKAKKGKETELCYITGLKLLSYHTE